MKKIHLHLNLNGMEAMLSKEQMKKIIGGYDGSEPSAPADNGGGSDGITNNGGYKCCWNDQPGNCSKCVPEATSKWTCVSGATLTKC